MNSYNYLLSTLILFLVLFSGNATAKIDRTTIVHIETECRHPETGGKVFPQGSGVIFDTAGYILTAAHLVLCRIEDVQYERRSVNIRRGIHRGEQIEVDVRSIAATEDIAVLKIVGVPVEYEHLIACRKAPLEEETPFVGYGFPEGKEYAPVPGSIGGETDSGNYAVVANFAQGMSGGPVVLDGYVVAIIEGGAGDVAARRSIVPLFRAGSVIEDAIGQSFPFCDDIGKFSVTLTVVVEEQNTETRAKTSRREGVSTGSLVDKTCQKFAFPATQGWTVDPDSVQISNRIAQGSSQASIVDISDSQVIVEFCARSILDGFSKKTGDSFGVVVFNETKRNSMKASTVIEANSEIGMASLRLPDNTVSWSGELLEIGKKRPVIFSDVGKIDNFQIEALGAENLLIQRLE